MNKGTLRKRPKRHSLMEVPRALRARLESLFPTSQDALSAVWHLCLHKLDLLCAPLERLLDCLSIASSMPSLFNGRRSLVRRM